MDEPTRLNLLMLALQSNPYFKVGILILALLGLWFLVELLLVGSRYRHGETLWSAIARHGNRRDFRVRNDQQHAHADTVEEANVIIAERIEAQPQMQTLVEQSVEPPTIVPSPPPPQDTPPPPQRSAPKFDVDATATMIEDMFLVKAGMIKVLWEQRSIEEAAGNIVGVQAVDLLIADFEATEVQKVWVLGNAKIAMTTS